MKSPLEAPEKQIAEETSVKPEKPAAAVIDTSKMAKGQREALELAEAARDPLEDRGSFASNLFVGRYDFDRIYPYPAQSAEDRAAGEEFLQKLESYLREHVDPDEIDRTGEIPPESVRLESRCRRNMADSVCRNPITDGPQFCLGVGMETLQRLFPLINRLESRNRCSFSAQKSRNKSICHALQAEKSRRSH
jgi:hypothetical protein